VDAVDKNPVHESSLQTTALDVVSSVHEYWRAILVSKRTPALHVETTTRDPIGTLLICNQALLNIAHATVRRLVIDVVSKVYVWLM